MLALFILIGATYKLNLFTLLNQYEEECYIYEKREVTKRYCDGVKLNLTLNGTVAGGCFGKTLWGERGWYNATTLESTGNCLRYHLVRKVQNQ